MSEPIWSGSFGDVAPGVTNATPAVWKMGPSARAESESVKPNATGTLSWLMSWLAVAAMTVGSVLVS